MYWNKVDIQKNVGNYSMLLTFIKYYFFYYHYSVSEFTTANMYILLTIICPAIGVFMLY